MDNLNNYFNKLQINNHLQKPEWLENMSLIELQKNINIILQSDQRSLFHSPSLYLNNQTRHLYEIELIHCLERLQKI